MNCNIYSCDLYMLNMEFLIYGIGKSKSELEYVCYFIGIVCKFMVKMSLCYYIFIYVWILRERKDMLFILDLYLNFGVWFFVIWYEIV